MIFRILGRLLYPVTYFLAWLWLRWLMWRRHMTEKEAAAYIEKRWDQLEYDTTERIGGKIASKIEKDAKKKRGKDE